MSANMAMISNTCTGPPAWYAKKPMAQNTKRITETRYRRLFMGLVYLTVSERDN
jgi:hypothetical protein